MGLFSKLAVAAVAFVAAASVPVVQAADWAVLVAGSNTFDNYRHQADVAHAYQIVKKNGIPPENIITFSYNDVANDPSNPFPGKIYNAPTAAGVPGVDVYQGGAWIDYQGAMVTPEVFIAVITNNQTGVANLTKTLQSTSEDRVFINFVDHGGPGLIAFPSEYLYATTLIPALEQMWSQKMYKKLVFYMEACESGSMFDGLLPTNMEMYVTTAANPTESSWGNYCPPDDSVDGTEVGSCLGDTYSTNWMENTDQVGPSETLQAQYLIVQNLTNQSHVMQYGALDFTSYPTGDFIGEGAAEEYVDVEVDLSRAAPKRSSQVSSRDIPLHLSYYRYLRAETFSPESAKHLAALRAQLDSREAAQNRFLKLAELLSVDSKGRRRGTAEHLFNAPATPIRSGVCIQSAVKALKANGCDYDDYSLQFHKVIVNACGRHSSEESGAKALIKAIQQVCA